MNQSLFKNIQKYSSKLQEIELEIFRKAPYLAVNLLFLPAESVLKIIKIYSINIKNRIDFQDKALADLFTQHIRITNEVLKKEELGMVKVNLNRLTIEQKILNSIFISHQLSAVIERPILADYILTKVSSASERRLLNVVDTKVEIRNPLSVDVSDFLIKNDYGEFDLTTTKKNESVNHAIGVNLSSLSSVYYQSKFIKTELEDNSEVGAFSFFSNSDEFERISHAGAYIISTSVAKYVYRFLDNDENPVSALEKTKKIFQKIAVEYLNTGSSKTDTIDIFGLIYSAIRLEIEDSQQLDDKQKISATITATRICLKVIAEWFAFPDSFYKLDFREASLEENEISPEVSHAIDVKLIRETGEIEDNLFETYIINYPEVVKQQISLLASQGIQNPEFITRLIEEEIEPDRFERVKNKIYAQIKG